MRNASKRISYTDVMKIKDISDDELLFRLKGSDSYAYRYLFDTYNKMLCCEAKKYIHESCVIEEIVGDVFRKIWENKTTLLINTSLRWYLVKAVHNNCISYLRNNDSVLNLDDINEAGSLCCLNESPMDRLVSKELEKKLNHVISALPGQYKKAFELSRTQDMSYREIAQEMDISVNTVKLYLKKSLAKLRCELTDYL